MRNNKSKPKCSICSNPADHNCGESPSCHQCCVFKYDADPDFPKPTVGEQTDKCLLCGEPFEGSDWVSMDGHGVGSCVDEDYYKERIASPTPIPVGEQAKPDITAKELIAYLYTDDMEDEGPFTHKNLQNILDWMERERSEASNVKN